MITQTLPIGNLFKIFELYEKLTFVPEKEHFLNSTVQIQNETGEWVNIPAAITKEDTGLQITFGNGDIVKGAKKHLIYTGDQCVFLSSLVIGDNITKASGEVIEVIDISDIPDTTFYDLSVDSPTHLYQTTNGIVHHNTELAKLLSENLSMKLIRFDMSEYQEKHTISKLIGSPPGYVGYEDGNLGGGLLISEIEKNPHCIILMDEIEKAHPDITNILLSMMDEGIVTGSNGKKADCRHAIIILTSNLGAADNERNNIGFGRELQKDGEDDDAVKKFFRPEFRNRLDGIVKFNKLDRLSMKQVVVKFLNELNDLLGEKSIRVRATEAMIDHLVDVGFDGTMGARPLSRKISELIKVPLSKKLLFEDIDNGSNITVDFVDDLVEFTVHEPLPLELPENKTVDEEGFIVI